MPVRDASIAPLRYGWSHIIRVGLVQACLGAMIVLMTSTLNRVMIVELALPALVPGALVGLHFLVQLWLRPRLGFGSDATGRRVTWIRGGMFVLAISGIAASATTLLIATNRWLGLTAAVVAFIGLGAGVSGAGTPLLALLAERVDGTRRTKAAATVWLMMIFGFIVTTVAASKGLAPYSHAKLVQVTAMVGLVILGITWLATINLDRGGATTTARTESASSTDFGSALRSVLDEPIARRFAAFIFLSMFAFSAQDLILEPYAGLVFGLAPAESTRVSGMHQGGMLAGMLTCAMLVLRIGTARQWATMGCLLSAVFFGLLAASPMFATIPVLKAIIFALGFSNGAFAAGAISTMMALTVDNGDGRSGLRMGVYGAAQAVGTGVGSFLGAVGSDVSRALLSSVSVGYGVVFAVEAGLFVLAGWFAFRSAPSERPAPAAVARGADHVLAVMR
jgi:BCD family chlorophyll transporter-like MFS transporter